MAFLRPFVSNIRPHNDLDFMLASNWNKLSTFSFFSFLIAGWLICLLLPNTSHTTSNSNLAKTVRRSSAEAFPSKHLDVYFL